MLLPQILLALFLSPNFSWAVPIEAIQDTLRKELQSLKNVSEAQKKIFEQEVFLAKQSPLFVTHYEDSSQGLKVDVDKEKLKNYLKFSAVGFVKDLKQDYTICAYGRVLGACSVCEILNSPLFTKLQKRLATRRFKIQQQTSLLLDDTQTGEAAFEKYLSLLPPSCQGGLYLEVSQPEQAAAQATQTEVRAVVYMELKDKEKDKVYSQGQALLNVPLDLGLVGSSHTISSFDVELAQAVTRQSIDLFSNAEGRKNIKTISNLNLQKQERVLRLEGIKNYYLYAQFKQNLLATLPGLILEERLLSPGVVQFAVEGVASLDTLAEKIRQLSLATKFEIKKEELEITVVLK